jgi:hypothetical protein
LSLGGERNTMSGQHRDTPRLQQQECANENHVVSSPREKLIKLLFIFFYIYTKLAVVEGEQGVGKLTLVEEKEINGIKLYVGSYVTSPSPFPLPLFPLLPSLPPFLSSLPSSRLSFSSC